METEEKRRKILMQLVRLHCIDCEGDTLKTLDNLALQMAEAGFEPKVSEVKGG